MKLHIFLFALDLLLKPDQFCAGKSPVTRQWVWSACCQGISSTALTPSFQNHRHNKKWSLSPQIWSVCVWGLELLDPSGRELEALQVQVLDKSELLLCLWCNSMQFKWLTLGNKRRVLKDGEKVVFLFVCICSDGYKINILPTGGQCTVC